MRQLAAFALFILTLFLLSAGKACGQDSLAVSLPAWDIRYHVFSGPSYIRWMENPYDENQDALVVYTGKYLQTVLVRDGAECRNYLPSKNEGRPVLQLSHKGCRMYYYVRGEIEKHIDQGTGSLDKL